MPLIKRDAGAAPAPESREPAPAPDALRDPDPERRRSAVRALPPDPEAVAPLAEALAAETAPAIREAILTALIRIGGPDAARAVASFLRVEDAALRNGAVEALQAMPESALDLLPGLLDDPDPDVRILATEVARSLPAGQATPILCRMLDREAHPNACAAAVDVLAETGTRDALPALRRIAERFPGDPFLPFAVSVAVARIEGEG